MSTADVEWARAAVRTMLLRVVGLCVAEFTVQGLTARCEARQALAAARACRRWK